MISWRICRRKLEKRSGSDLKKAARLRVSDRQMVEVAFTPDALEQFARETIEELLKEMPAEERLKGLSAKERRLIKFGDWRNARDDHAYASSIQRG